MIDQLINETIINLTTMPGYTAALPPTVIVQRTMPTPTLVSFFWFMGGMVTMVIIKEIEGFIYGYLDSKKKQREDKEIYEAIYGKVDNATSK